MTCVYSLDKWQLFMAYIHIRFNVFLVFNDICKQCDDFVLLDGYVHFDDLFM